MEENFYNDEFEQFLRQQANNHRMYPSDGVWLGIYKKLHGHKTWPALTVTALVFFMATVAISLYFGTKPSIFKLDPIPVSGTPSVALQNSSLSHPLAKASATEQKIANTPQVITNNNQTGVTDITTIALVETPVTSDVALADPAAVVVSNIRLVKPPVLHEQLAQRPLIIEPAASIAIDNSALLTDQVVPTDLAAITEADSIKKSSVPFPVGMPSTDPSDKNMADQFLEQHKNDIALYTTNRVIANKKRWDYQVYIAPSFSYRKLKEDGVLNQTSQVNGPVALNYVTDVNKVVRHKPGVGLELGGGVLYHITNTFGVKAGLQFNVRQYNIEAYRAPSELTTIALFSSSGNDTISTLALYRNHNGLLSTELVNRYYQVSIPVGVQWQVIGNNRVNLNVAATIQPTYYLSRNSYLLSTNFKNYTGNGGMLRNWNVNSSLETFISIKAGEYKWQFGPQLRYQHLPTFSSQYPIREYLLDYGFKVGVSKMIK